MSAKEGGGRGEGVIVGEMCETVKGERCVCAMCARWNK